MKLSVFAEYGEKNCASSQNVKNEIYVTYLVYLLYEGKNVKYEFLREFKSIL